MTHIGRMSGPDSAINQGHIAWNLENLSDVCTEKTQRQLRKELRERLLVRGAQLSEGKREGRRTV